MRWHVPSGEPEDATFWSEYQRTTVFLKNADILFYGFDVKIKEILPFFAFLFYWIPSAERITFMNIKKR